MRRWVWSVFLAVTMLGGVHLPAQTGPKEPVEQALMQADREFCQAVQAKDLPRFRAFIGADPWFFGGGGPSRTVEAVVEAWSPLFAADATGTLTWEPTVAVAASSGDLGYTIGVYTRRVVDPEGKTSEKTGHYVTIWKKAGDGRWVVAVDIGTPPQPK